MGTVTISVAGRSWSLTESCSSMRRWSLCLFRLILFDAVSRIGLITFVAESRVNLRCPRSDPHLKLKTGF